MSRIQLALNVDDLDQVTAFYSKLFGVAPAKTRPGYANFAVAEPALKLALFENPGRGGTLNQPGVEVGVEVDLVHELDAEHARLAEAGLATRDERGTTCCYAKQDKFWMEGTPSGERWEVYTVLADAETSTAQPTPAACCSEGSVSTSGAEPAAASRGCCG